MSDVNPTLSGPATEPAIPGGGAPPASERPFLVGLKRGVCRRCPTCGKGALFRSYLKVRERCPVCAADNGRYPADDAPPYVTIFLVGHLTIPPMLWFGETSTLSVGVLLAIFLPLIIILSVAILPFAKGAVVGLEWSWDIVRPDATTDEAAIPTVSAQQGGGQGAAADDTARSLQSLKSRASAPL